MYLIALDNQVIPYSEIMSHNYLPDNVSLDVKFILESNSSRTSSSSQAQTQTPIILWCQILIYPKSKCSFCKPSAGRLYGERCRPLSPRVIECSTGQIKCSSGQIKCSAGRIKFPTSQTALGLLNTENFSKGIVYKALLVSWADKEVI